jgi:hypothetical protein
MTEDTPDTRRREGRAEDESLGDILRAEVSDDRAERLQSLTRPDAQVGDETRAWLVRQQARWTNIQYARFNKGLQFTERDVDDILTNSIDTHAHGGSDPIERLMLEDDLAYDCTDVGMRAVVIKTWYTPSASRNPLVQKLANRYAEERGLRPVQVFGGVTLNYAQGGLNPEAVRKCLGFPGMKYVWMPMVDSYHHRRVIYDDWSGHGINFLDARRRLLPEMREILRIVADNDLVLACGHYPFEDAHLLFQEAVEVGVRGMQAVHPAHIHSKHSIEQMQQQAALGVKLEVSGLGAEAFPLHESGPLYAAQVLAEVGADNCVYASDLGQLQNFPHIVGNRWMIKLLLAYGCTKEQLHQLFQVTPARHLGLEDPPPLDDPGAKASRVGPSFAGYPQADPAARDHAHNRYAPRPTSEDR